jgi:hypothetical protein
MPEPVKRMRPCIYGWCSAHAGGTTRRLHRHRDSAQAAPHTARGQCRRQLGPPGPEGLVLRSGRARVGRSEFAYSARNLLNQR